MKSFVAAVVLMLPLVHAETAREDTGTAVVLPSPELLRCKSSNCQKLWSEKSGEGNKVFPKQISIDLKQGCIYALTAQYDKSVAFDDIKTAIDTRYAKYAAQFSANAPVKAWRVESEKFAIQLAALDKKKDEKLNMGEAGTKQVIYIAFGASSACQIP